jgi:galactokinase
MYCSEMTEHARSRVLAAFERRFGVRPNWLVRAPGRVNLLGAHVDYVEGWVLPGAIDRAVWLAARPASGPEGIVEALDLGEVGSIDTARIPPPASGRKTVGTDWLDLPRGVAWALDRVGVPLPPLDLVFGSDLPIGAGLSSSAAVEVAFSMAWEAASGVELSDLDRARLGQSVENDYLGVGSGIMDQYASIHGCAGHLVLLDCRTLESELVRLPTGLAVLIADTGIRRTLAGSDYNDRPAECRQAADALRRHLPHVRTLRDVTSADLERFGGALAEPLLLRARHAVGECQRVPNGAAALAAGDAETFGAIMRASHESSRDLYQVSIPELDLLAETAWASDGCYGARLSGAGFGGCVTALVDEEASKDVAEHLRQAFEQAFGQQCSIYTATIADGAQFEDL